MSHCGSGGNRNCLIFCSVIFGLQTRFRSMSFLSHSCSSCFAYEVIFCERLITSQPMMIGSSASSLQALPEYYCTQKSTIISIICNLHRLPLEKILLLQNHAKSIASHRCQPSSEGSVRLSALGVHCYRSLISVLLMNEACVKYGLHCCFKRFTDMIHVLLKVQRFWVFSRSATKGRSDLFSHCCLCVCLFGCLDSCL